MTHRITFRGCSPEPLSPYLKGLAIFRLIAEQLDPSARASWRGDVLSVETRCDQAAIERFFLHDYQPTPIVSPWNGGSGFFPKDNKAGLSALRDAPPGTRFARYAETIRAAQRVLDALGLTERPDSGDAKTQLLAACRGQLPDEALPWLDAAFILTSSEKGLADASYPPLLGTGGNDGRLDFSNNFMRHVASTLFDAATGAPQPQAEALLRAALFGVATDGLTDDSIGQFFPAASGGVNVGSGFGGRAVVNPWDFVLSLEGAVLFAASAVRRMSAQSLPAVCAPPFTVRSISAGYGSAAASEKSRAEVWLPLWDSFTSLRELRALLAEGRARLFQRPVQSALDFSRAVASLGVDRGVRAFSRIGILERNGLAFFGVPLGRFVVPKPAEGLSSVVAVLEDIQDWMATLQRAADEGSAPRAVCVAAQQLQGDVVEVCRLRDEASLVRVFLSLGRCERALARSVRWVLGLKYRLSPLVLRSPQWLLATSRALRGAPRAGTFRVAASLASVGMEAGAGADDGAPALRLPLMREHLEPVKRAASGRWWEFSAQASPDVVWHEGVLARSLCGVMQRRLIAAQRLGLDAFPDAGYGLCAFSDIDAWMSGQLGGDDARALQDMLWACALVSPSGYAQAYAQGLGELDLSAGEDLQPSALYGILRLCFSRWRPAHGRGVPVSPQLFQLLASGRAAEASARAVARLWASGTPTPLGARGVVAQNDAEAALRTAAALLIPLTQVQHARLCERWLVRPVADKDPT